MCFLWVKRSEINIFRSNCSKISCQHGHTLAHAGRTTSRATQGSPGQEASPGAPSGRRGTIWVALPPSCLHAQAFLVVFILCKKWRNPDRLANHDVSQGFTTPITSTSHSGPKSCTLQRHLAMGLWLQVTNTMQGVSVRASLINASIP